MTHRHTPAKAGPLGLPAPGEDPGPHHELQLPGTPWSVHTAGWPGARPSMEVYAAGVLLDVVVLTPFSACVLRGACRAAPAGEPQALAWGRLPADGAPVAVDFSRFGLRPQARPAQVTEVGGWFWMAVASGRFTAATAWHRDGREHCRARRLRL